MPIGSLEKKAISDVLRIKEDIAKINDFVGHINMRSFRTQEALKQIAASLNISLTLEDVLEPGTSNVEQQIIGVDTSGVTDTEAITSAIEALTSTFNTHTHEYEDLYYVDTADGTSEATTEQKNTSVPK